MVQSSSAPAPDAGGRDRWDEPDANEPPAECAKCSRPPACSEPVAALPVASVLFDLPTAGETRRSTGRVAGGMPAAALSLFDLPPASETCAPGEDADYGADAAPSGALHSATSSRPRSASTASISSSRASCVYCAVPLKAARALPSGARSTGLSPRFLLLDIRIVAPVIKVGISKPMGSRQCLAKGRYRCLQDSSIRKRSIVTL